MRSSFNKGNVHNAGIYSWSDTDVLLCGLASIEMKMIYVKELYEILETNVIRQIIYWNKTEKFYGSIKSENFLFLLIFNTILFI